MFYNFYLCCIVITVSLIVGVQNFKLNMTEYYKMPKLYDFDDYDRCLYEYDTLSVYCFVRAEIQSQSSNTETCRIIADISKSYKHHYNHSHLYFGVCVKWCENLLAPLDINVLTELHAGTLRNNIKVDTYLKLFTVEEPNRKHYNRQLNQCINLKLNSSYGLRAKSVIEYCDSNRMTIQNDAWNITFYVIFCVLIFLLTCSTFFDFYLKHERFANEKKEINHYKEPIKTNVGKLCVIFSIPRNWYRLNQEAKGKMARDLRFLECFKFMTMFLVIFAHTSTVFYEYGIQNPQHVEQSMHTPAGTLLISGSLITMTFLVIGGLLLAINWIELTKKKTNFTFMEYIVVFIKFNIYRYIRLTAPYAFLVLLSGVHIENGGGPMWRHIVEREQLACRKNWWTNLLYVNNFVNTNERCLLQSWYLAVDYQLFNLCLILLIICHKWSNIRKYLFVIVSVISCLIPGIVTYVSKLEPIVLATLQVQRDAFIEEKTFNEYYTPFYMNYFCYICGIVGAYIYEEITVKQIKLHESIVFQVLWYAMLPIGVLWLFTAHTFYQNYDEKPSLLWSSAYAAIQRNFWSFALTLIIIGMSSKVGWIFRKFSCHPIFRVLGRLTYGAFIVHLLLIRVVVATLRQPIFFSTGIMFAFVTFGLTASYFLSFLLAFLLELPVSSLLKMIR